MILAELQRFSQRREQSFRIKGEDSPKALELQSLCRTPDSTGE
jgi:hypothetical protein